MLNQEVICCDTTKFRGVSYYAHSDTMFTASINGQEVASMELQRQETQDEDRVWLSNIEVYEGYQQRGIGSELIRLAVRFHGNEFKIPANSGLLGDRFKYYLSEEGEALTNSCIRKGIVNKTLHCSACSPLNEDHTDYSSGDNTMHFFSDDTLEEQKREEEEEEERWKYEDEMEDRLLQLDQAKAGKIEKETTVSSSGWFNAATGYYESQKRQSPRPLFDSSSSWFNAVTGYYEKRLQPLVEEQESENTSTGPLLTD